MKRKPPIGQPWVWLTRELVQSDAWRTMSGKARKVIDFLLLEDMGKGGKHNGKLKAPFRQLIKYGIGSHHVADAIRECEERGLIDVQRGGMRIATTYALTWFPLHDGTPASDRWRAYKIPKKQKSAYEMACRAAYETAFRHPNSASETACRSPQNPAYQTACALKISSYQGGEDTSDLSVGAARSRLRVVPDALP